MKAASLNHVYRLVWSSLQQAWVAVAETTRAHGKSSVNGQVRAIKKNQWQVVFWMLLLHPRPNGALLLLVHLRLQSCHSLQWLTTM